LVAEALNILLVKQLDNWIGRRNALGQQKKDMKGKTMGSDDEGRSSYMDLLVTTLMEHEKNMDRLLEKLERIAKNLALVLEQTSLKAGKLTAKEERPQEKPDSDNLTYIKININRPVHEVLEILESLKK